MKKVKRITTTEFYRNPSKALNFVKEGGSVYIGYKNLTEPFAMLTDFKKDDDEEIDKEALKKRRLAALKKYQIKGSGRWKSGLDLQDAVRE